MTWGVEFHTDFIEEYEKLPEEVQDELWAIMKALEVFGPLLGRPRVDTLNGSRFTNMKELRFEAVGGIWRFAFIFDHSRRAIILCGGDKSGVNEKRFYQKLINKADRRFDSHCIRIREDKI